MKFDLQSQTDLGPVFEHLGKIEWEHGVRIEITQIKGCKSTSQNSTLWMWYQELYEKFRHIEGIGSKDDIHDLMCSIHLGYYEKTMGKTVVRMMRTTTKPQPLDKGEMHEYMEKVYQWALGKKVFLTLPEVGSEYMTYREAQK